MFDVPGSRSCFADRQLQVTLATGGDGWTLMNWSMYMFPTGSEVKYFFPHPCGLFRP